MATLLLAAGKGFPGSLSYWSLEPAHFHWKKLTHRSVTAVNLLSEKPPCSQIALRKVLQLQVMREFGATGGIYHLAALVIAGDRAASPARILVTGVPPNTTGAPTVTKACRQGWL